MYSFDCSLFSKYRTFLMGVAIIGIMLGHSCIWLGNPLPFKYFAEPFSRLVHTEGFFFLSGLGLYFSFSKNNSILDFYKKRVYRVLIPFMIIAFPYYLKTYIVDHNVVSFLLKESALYFFIYGNNGMWYISMSLLLYFLFPYAYKLVFRTDYGLKLYIRNTLFLVLGSLLFCFVLNSISPVYYEKVQIGFEKTPIFFLGMLFGYLAKEKIEIPVHIIIILFSFFFFLYVGKRYFEILTNYSEMLLRLVCMIIIVFFIDKFEKNRLCGFCVDIFNRFGIYSLELYILHMLLYSYLKGNIQNFGFEVNDSNQMIIVVSSILLSLLLCKPVHRGIDLIISRIK